MRMDKAARGSAASQRALRLLLAGGMMLFSGCSDASEDSDGGGGGGPRSADATALEGRWITNCISDGEGFFVIDEREFEGKALQAVFQTYEGSDCRTPVMTQEQKGTFSLGDELDKPEGAMALNITIEKVWMTLHTQSLVRAYNDRGICGGGWEAEKRRRISREQCLNDGGGKESAGADEIYDIFRLDGGTLHFGDKTGAKDGQSKSSRPTALRTDRSFRKE